MVREKTPWIISLMLQHKRETSNRKDKAIVNQPTNLVRKIKQQKRLILICHLLTNSKRWQPWKSLKSTLIQNRKESISSGNTKWNSRLRCVEIGSSLESAFSRIRVPSPMENMSSWKNSTCPKILKLSPAHSSTQQAFALMVTDVNFSIPSLISLTQLRLTNPTLPSWKKMPDYQRKEHIQ